MGLNGTVSSRKEEGTVSPASWLGRGSKPGIPLSGGTAALEQPETPRPRVALFPCNQLLPPREHSARCAQLLSDKNRTFICQEKLVFFLFPVKTATVIVFILKRKIIGEKPTIFLLPGVGV